MSRFGLTGGIALACGLLMWTAAGGSAAERIAARSGSAAVRAGARGSVFDISCAAVGDCAAVGTFESKSGYDQAFVANETNRRWGKAIVVPRMGTLNRTGNAFGQAISCDAPGDCAAGGFYGDTRGATQAFVVSERNGTWRKAIEVPGTAKLNSAGNGQVDSISCAAKGDCVAGGDYEDSSHQFQAFVASESHWAWSDAIEVPGLAPLNSGGEASVLSISCPAAGECAAGGSYAGPTVLHAFVVNETNGSWGTAIEVQGVATEGTAEVDEVSCAAPGECTAAGTYTHGYGHKRAFVVSETNGSWGQAIDVPSPAALDNPWAELGSVSCAAPGDCTAGGDYRSQNGPGRHLQAFVVSEIDGAWGKALEVPGTARLNTGGIGAASSVSCTAPGDCTVGGAYENRHGGGHDFLISETNGKWGKAIRVPDMALPRSRGEDGLVVSCAATGDCGAAGDYTDRSYESRALVVSEIHGRWGSAAGLSRR